MVVRKSIGTIHRPSFRWTGWWSSALCLAIWTVVSFSRSSIWVEPNQTLSEFFFSWIPSTLPTMFRTCSRGRYFVLPTVSRGSRWRPDGR